MNRVALVIGNAQYKYVAKLNNPENDARDMASVLQRLGFKVIKCLNASLAELQDKITCFLKELDEYSVGLLYYAGHGMQIDGKNYIVPVDCKLTDKNKTIFSCYSMEDYLNNLSIYKDKTNIVILDACRNNPFINGRGFINGFSEFHNQPKGTIIAFSTSSDCTASDGFSSNGLYTQVLKDDIQIPNMKIEDIFKSVRIKVSELSLKYNQEEQISWEHSSLVGDFYFSVVPQSVSPNYSDEEIYKYIKEQCNYFEAKTDDIYDIECMPYVDAYNHFKIPVIKLLRAFSRVQYRKQGKEFSDATIDEINFHYLTSWGFENKYGRWYYKSNYVEMGDLMPLTEELSPPIPVSGCEININGTIEAELEDGKVRFSLDSNIPKDTPLIFSLYKKNYSAQGKVTVTDDIIKTEWFSFKGKALPDGHYKLHISAPIYSVLPETVKKVFGVRNRNIVGKNIKFDPISGNTISMDFEFIIRDDKITHIQ